MLYGSDPNDFAYGSLADSKDLSGGLIRIAQSEEHAIDGSAWYK
jgi:hypothetical protein